MPDTYSSSNFPFGSRVLTINAVTYVAENFEVTNTTGPDIVRLDETGVPNGQYVARGLNTGSATLQLATSSTAVPAQFQTFTEDTVSYVILTVSAPEGNTVDQKVNITFRETI